MLAAGFSGARAWAADEPAFYSKLRIPEAGSFYARGDRAVLSRDGKWVFADNYANNKIGLAVYSALTGQRTRELPLGKPEVTSVSAIALSADGKVAAAAVGFRTPRNQVGEDQEVRTWNFSSGQPLKTIPLRLGSMNIAAWLRPTDTSLSPAAYSTSAARKATIRAK